jgi:hypothetical protein
VQQQHTPRAVPAKIQTPVPCATQVCWFTRQHQSHALSCSVLTCTWLSSGAANRGCTVPAHPSLTHCWCSCCCWRRLHSSPRGKLRPAAALPLLLLLLLPALLPAALTTALWGPRQPFTAAAAAVFTARAAAATAPRITPWAACIGRATAAEAAPSALLPVLLLLPPVLPAPGVPPGGGGSVGMAHSAWRASSVSAPKPMHTAHCVPDSGTVLKARPPICTMATCRQHRQ